jgi:hypothetical protein
VDAAGLLDQRRHGETYIGGDGLGAEDTPGTYAVSRAMSQHRHPASAGDGMMQTVGMPLAVTRYHDEVVTERCRCRFSGSNR